MERELRFELAGQRYAGSGVIGMVRVLAADGLVFNDGVNLSTAKGRAEFIGALRERLGGAVPEGLDLEGDLLRLLQMAEARLAEAGQGRPTGDGAEERCGDYAKRDDRFEFIEGAGPVERRVALTNFVAEIVEDLAVDDGAER